MVVIDSSSVSSKLASGVVSISSCYRAFAAIKSGGSVVTWGTRGAYMVVTQARCLPSLPVWSAYHRLFVPLPPSSRTVQFSLGVVNWKVVTISKYSKTASGVVSISSSLHAFAAIKSTDGSVMVWGD